MCMMHYISLPNEIDAFSSVSQFISNNGRSLQTIKNTDHVSLLPDVIKMSTSMNDDTIAIADNNNIEQVTESNDTFIDISHPFYTSAVLKIAYDGTHFNGWTGGNAADQKPKQSKRKNTYNHSSQEQTQKRRQSRRSRTLQRKGGGWYGSTNNKVRTVEETIRMSLAKVYGNVNPKQIVFDACSRTDAGVHATSLVAQFYCYTDEAHAAKSSDNSTGLHHSLNSTIPIRPNAPNDETMFVQLPFNSDLSKLVYVLNRMLPPDVRILAASPMPTVDSTSSLLTKYAIDAFHPTLSTTSKTYAYKFSIGNIQDPLRSRFVWHLDGSSNRAMGMNGKNFDLDLAGEAARLFVCSEARDYAAFGSVMRGSEKNRDRSTICTIWRCDLLYKNREQLPSWESSNRVGDATVTTEKYERCGSRFNADGSPFHPLEPSSTSRLSLSNSPQTFTVVVTGDRFMYKMVRNIVGTIVAVACGHNQLADIQKAIETGFWGNGPSGSRRICAPARGLELIEVTYPDDVHFEWQSG